MRFTRWKDIPLAIKLYVVIGIMGLLIATELLTLRFAMHTLSSVRAFVGGEGLWSKAQKTSVIALQKFVDSRDEKDFAEFQKWLQVSLGDRAARLEMEKPEPDMKVIYAGFEKGRVHHDDVVGVYQLVRRFYWAPHLARALAIWRQADVGIQALVHEAEDLRLMVNEGAEREAINAKLGKIMTINNDLTVIEDDFSRILGEGSRWLEGVVMFALLCVVLTVESTGVFLTISFSRNLSRALKDLIQVATCVGQGDFTKRSTVESKNELGQLATALNTMSSRLQENVGSRRQAEEASQTKSAFLANMSHEIRTPLAAILGFTEILKDPLLSNEERERFLATIQRNGEALTKVINDILDLSKVEAGGVSIEYLDFYLPSLLQDVTDLFSANAADKGIELKVSVDPSAQIQIKSDPTRLKQILFNIVGNAIKFTNAGSVRVHAALFGNRIRIRVQDTGVGITEAQRQKLFAPFTQADNSTSRKFGGTGLGLALSRKLAEALGGTVYIESDRGFSDGGSVFIVEIEDRKASSLQRSRMATPPPPAQKPLAPKSISGTRVLVVDDSADNRELLRLLLKRQGAATEFAVNGKNAVDVATQSDYDVVLMDIQMPEMDGYAALKALQGLGYRKPIIAFTAHAMKEERERCLAAGFAAHVTKPVNEAALITAISQFV